MRILVCNAGSSSLKFSLFEDDNERLLGRVAWTRRGCRLASVDRPYPGHRHAGGHDHCPRDPAGVAPLIRPSMEKEGLVRLLIVSAHAGLTWPLCNPGSMYCRRCIPIHTVAHDPCARSFHE